MGCFVFVIFVTFLSVWGYRKCKKPEVDEEIKKERLIEDQGPQEAMINE